MTLRVYNTLSGEKELFEPVTPGKVGIYLCGPTVYKPAHIGHAVGPVIFDVIKRYLTYKGFDVTWVVNVTDVEDKLIAEAEKQGRTMLDLARELEQQYLDSLNTLGIRSIDHMPRASEHISDIINLIQILVDRGIAYAADGDVYFDVMKDEDYGKLSNRKPEEQFACTREGMVHGAKRNTGDFTLWKAAKPEEPDSVKYDSPWGSGRPGWHIECSAMAQRYLGDTLDMHGGGLDLKFPHHENEIAQSESATDKPFAKFWMHNGLTRFNTKKISKSDPDFEKIMESLQLTNLLKKHSPELLRFLIVQSQYRSPIDFSDEALAAAKTGLGTFYRLFDRLERTTGADPYEITLRIEQMRDTDPSPRAKQLMEEVTAQFVRFLEAMDDDFNTAGAIAVIFDLAGMLNRFLDETRLETHADEAACRMVQAASGTMMMLARLLGLFIERSEEPKLEGDSMTSQLMELVISVRKMARQSKQFEIADHIRDELGNMNIVMEDRPDGTEWRLE